jgi:hypothetical protein
LKASKGLIVHCEADAIVFFIEDGIEIPDEGCSQNPLGVGSWVFPDGKLASSRDGAILRG